MSDPEKTPEPAVPAGPSSCYAQMFFIFVILCVIGINGKDSWWGIIPHVLALGMLATGARESLSREAFEQILQQYPRETREHYRVNSLFSMVVVPGLVWLFLGAPALFYWVKH